MSELPTESETHQDRRTDDDVLEAPQDFWGICKQFGPGLIVAASIVGSGELIATTKSGAQAGITLLWLIIIGCLIKVFVQIELGRHALTYGTTTLQSLNQIPGRLLGLNYLIWFWLVMMLAGMFQQGGIVGGVGQAAALAFPLTGDYREAIRVPSERELNWLLKWEEEFATPTSLSAELSEEKQGRIQTGMGLLRDKLDRLGDEGVSILDRIQSGESVKDPYTYDDKYWAAIFTISVILLLYSGKYSILQTMTMGLIVCFTIITIGNVVSLQMTEAWSISAKEFLEGLSFGLPKATDDVDPMATALATFGIIGVGAAELVTYPYWCLEKGYARHVGPRHQGEQWAKRARGWMRIMHYDVFASMVVYTVATVAFYMLGAAVLHRNGQDPEGMRMVSTLAEAYIPIFGEYANWLFLVGAIAVLYSTFLVAIASFTRLYTDFFKIAGLLPKDNAVVHQRSITTLAVVLPCICLISYCLNFKPDQAVLLAGKAQAIFLPMLGLAAVYFRFRMCDGRLKPSRWFDAMLIISCAGFVVIGIWNLI